MTIKNEEVKLTDPYRIAAFAREAHQNAVDKGWWTTDQKGKAVFSSRNISELLMLAVSEAAEALEVYREGIPLDKVWKNDKGKPEGFPIEVADIVIRLLDTMAAADLPIADLVLAEQALYIILRHNVINDNDMDEDYKLGASSNVGESLMKITFALSQVHDYVWNLTHSQTEVRPTPQLSFSSFLKNNGFLTRTGVMMSGAINLCFRIADRFGFDLWSAIITKHEYNKNRPLRHGNKLA
jgi:hypothetical protein